MDSTASRNLNFVKDKPMSDQSHKPEDSIEKVFQVKAREYEISYLEEDWLKLKIKLDLMEGQKIRLAKIQYFGFFLN
jgi:hypothetical protein